MILARPHLRSALVVAVLAALLLACLGYRDPELLRSLGDFGLCR